MQNIRNIECSRESNENSIEKAYELSNNIDFIGFKRKYPQEEPFYFRDSNLSLENENSDFLNFKKIVEQAKHDNYFSCNCACDKEFSKEQEYYNNNLDFGFQNTNEDNYFAGSCKSEENLYQRSLGGNSSSKYFYNGNTNFDKNAVSVIEKEFEGVNNERNYENIEDRRTNKITEDMHIHNIIFSERSDKKELNEDSDFLKNAYFFTKNASTSENVVNLNNNFASIEKDPKEEGINCNSNLKSEKTNSKSNTKDSSCKEKDFFLKDIDKINSLINSLFLSEISSYDKFLLIYKIGNILKQEDSAYKNLILEIIDKYREKNKDAENSKKDYNHFKEEIAVLYDNYSDSKLKFMNEDLIKSKKAFVAKLLKFFMRFLKRNKFIIVKNSN